MIGADVGVRHAELSIIDGAAVDALIAHRQPDVVFNCAAYNAVDQAEAEPDLAMHVNLDGALNVASACARRGARLVHYSTNFVFDGELDRAYVESDVPRPLSVYGASKLAGERAVLASGANAIVIRSAAVYGIVGTGFPERVLERARHRGRLEMVDDQRVNPTYARELAERSIELAGGDVTGLVHLVCEGCCTWLEFARAALDELGDSAVLQPVPSRSLERPARRPSNGCLGSERIRLLRPWRDALHDWGAVVARGGRA